MEVRMKEMIQAQVAFNRARRKAFLREVWYALQGRPNQLLAFDDVLRQVGASHPIYRGLQTVPVDRIIGSVGRYNDFDRVFLPNQSHTGARWRRIGQAYYGNIELPPVELYQVGDIYFVGDGNHRVSVARQLGQEFIDARVRECRTRVPLTPDLDPQHLEIIGEKVRFIEETKFDELFPDMEIEFTFPGGYYRLLDHIEVHRYYQSQESGRELTFHEAVRRWVDNVYLPLIDVIRETNVLADFPRRTEADLYLWIIEHQYYMRERFGDRIGPRDAARNFANHFTTRILKRVWHFVTHHILPQPSMWRRSRP